MLSGPPHEASAAHTRCPGTLESERAGSQANRVAPAHRARPAASEAKGLCRRCDGAVPGRDRWFGSSVFSSPPPPRVKNGAAYAKTGRQPVPHRRRRAPGRLLRETRDGTPTMRRARSSLASETQTKRNAPRRHTHRVTPPPATQAAATPSSPSTRTEVARLMSGSCGRSSRPWARSRPRRSCFR